MEDITVENVHAITSSDDLLSGGVVANPNEDDEEMMPDLEKKLDIELKHESEVVACRFPFPQWIPSDPPQISTCRGHSWH